MSHLEGKFHCDRCGECCRHLDLSAMHQDLDRGDGVCRYLDGNLCSIYDSRPLKCRVDEGYVLFRGTISKDVYYEMNYKMCQWLKDAASALAHGC